MKKFRFISTVQLICAALAAMISTFVLSLNNNLEFFDLIATPAKNVLNELKEKENKDACFTCCLVKYFYNGEYHNVAYRYNEDIPRASVTANPINYINDILYTKIERRILL